MCGLGIELVTILDFEIRFLNIASLILVVRLFVHLLILAEIENKRSKVLPNCAGKVSERP